MSALIEKCADPKLLESRKEAARQSRGISGNAIRNLVLKLVEKHKDAKNVLDYGAGAGQLLEMLRSALPSASLAGSDIVARPADLHVDIDWIEGDLNEQIMLKGAFDLVLAVEVIEHLENPRATARQLFDLLEPGGYCIVTTPNQESIRSLLALVLEGHYAAFRGASYPAHITALLREDLRRIFTEAGFTNIHFAYTDKGGLPRMVSRTWQQLSFGFLRGRRFSDNVALIAQRPF